MIYFFFAMEEIFPGVKNTQRTSLAFFFHECRATFDLRVKARHRGSAAMVMKSRK